jgi:hypothetical protein
VIQQHSSNKCTELTAEKESVWKKLKNNKAPEQNAQNSDLFKHAEKTIWNVMKYGQVEVHRRFKGT